MYCTHCGAAHPDPAATCPACGQPIQRVPPLPPVRNHLVSAVFVTLCCCLPLGVVSLIYAAQVNSRLAAGDVAGAQAASRNAYTWALVGVLAGLLTFGGMALISMIG